MVNRLAVFFWIVSCLCTNPVLRSGALENPEEELSVSISNASCDSARRPAFDWEITNREKQTEYVYSTFLYGPSATAVLDNPSHVYTIWTSLPNETDIMVNEYPPAKFLQIKPGEVLRGRFREPQEGSCGRCGVSPKEAIRIALQVSFGSSTESVEAELREGHYANPANPIVRWQQIAISPTIPFPKCKAN
jgi:hypothetical protein